MSCHDDKHHQDNSHIDWKAGPPVYDVRVNGEGDRYVLLVLHDQSGHLFEVIGYLYGEQPPGLEAWDASVTAWLAGDRKEKAPDVINLVPRLTVPCLKSDNPLSGWQNIVKSADIPAWIWLSHLSETKST